MFLTLVSVLARLIVIRGDNDPPNYR
jgi:hypothetical protein